MSNDDPKLPNSMFPDQTDEEVYQAFEGAGRQTGGGGPDASVLRTIVVFLLFFVCSAAMAFGVFELVELTGAPEAVSVMAGGGIASMVSVVIAVSAVIASTE